MPSQPEPSPPGISPFWALALIFGLNLGLPFLPLPNLGAAVAANLVVTLIYVGAVVAFALGVARSEWDWWIALAVFAFSALAWLTVERVGGPIVAGFFQTIANTNARPSTLQSLAVGYVQTLQDAALLCGAVGLGNLLSRGVRAANMLGPIGAVIALIDIWGVLFGGIVSQLLANKATQPLAAKAMTGGPQVGAVGAARPEFFIPPPAVGVGDFLFLGLLLGIIVNHRMNWRTPAWLIWILVSLALLSITFLPIPPLPGLVFIGAGAVLPNLKFFTYTRDERFALLYAGIFVVILTVGLYFGFTAMLPPNPEISPGARAPSASAPDKP